MNCFLALPELVKAWNSFLGSSRAWNSFLALPEFVRAWNSFLALPELVTAWNSFLALPERVRAWNNFLDLPECVRAWNSFLATFIAPVFGHHTTTQGLEEEEASARIALQTQHGTLPAFLCWSHNVLQEQPQRLYPARVRF